jgi:prolipoprotein diacylglyceryltransferase
MVGAGLIFFLARRCFSPRGSGLSELPRRERLTIHLAAFIGGVLGAKLPFVFVRGTDWFGAAWLADGKTVTTGLMGAYVGVELAKRWLGVTVKTGDAFALPLALALAVGRWGCFLHGCCSGVPTHPPWGVDFGDGVPRHPTQIYESLFHFAMALVLVQLVRHGRLRNRRLKLYLMCYGGYRFLTEFLRPEPEYALGLTYFQWVALVLLIGPGVQWWWEGRGAARPLDRGCAAPLSCVPARLHSP